MRVTLFCFVVCLTIYYVSCAGGISNVDVTDLRHDDNLKNLFQLAVMKYNERINSVYSHVPFQVHSIQKQVVAGMLYKFDVTLIYSKCKNKKSFNTLVDCGIKEDIPPSRATLQIIEQPWNNPSFIFTVINEEPNYDLQLHDQLFVIGIDDSETVSGLDFGKFKEKYGKQYESLEEDARRSKIFHSNFRRALLMQIIEKGTAKYGTNEFSDLTVEEFTKQRLTPAWDLTKMPKRKAKMVKMLAPPSVDWRKKGAVTEVKNQKSCGSCWAFSTTGNIEGQWFRKTKQLVSLSEQQLVDCDHIDNGCGGGLPSQAYKAIEGMGGLETESEYPYEAKRETCQFVRKDVKAYINDSLTISSDENQMATWNAINGPISIGINAFAMQFYTGGVSHPYSIFCNSNHLDHGVLIVGYNSTSSGEPYWIVKNSWGPSWGEQGYYLVYRGKGVCGLNKMPTSALIK